MRGSQSGLRAWVWGALVVVVLASGGRAGGAEPPLRVAVSIPPLESLTREVAPAGTEVHVLIPPGRSEHGFEFTPADLALVARADVVVLVGLDLEPRIEKFLSEQPNPRRRVVRFAEVVGLRQVDVRHGDSGHDESDPSKPAPPASEHEHDALPLGWVDQHLWLDPSLVERLVPALGEAIGKALEAKGTLDDAAKAALGRAQGAALARVRQVDAEYRERLGPMKGKAFVTNHNAFSRLAQRYGLTIACTLRELENSEPTPSEVAGIVRAVKDRRACAIFVEPQYSQSVGQRLARQAGVKVGRLDAMGTGDWAALMRGNLDELARALGD